MKSLKRQLKDLRSAATPSRSFKRALWMQLKEEMESTSPARVVSRGFRFALAGTLVVAFVFLSGVGTYAYASPTVGDGNVLFPVKRGIEEIQGVAMKFGPEGKEKYNEFLQERRVLEVEAVQEELEEMKVRFEDMHEKRLQRAAQHFDIDVEELRELKQNDELKRERLKQFRERQRPVFERLVEQSR